MTFVEANADRHVYTLGGIGDEIIPTIAIIQIVDFEPGKMLDCTQAQERMDRELRIRSAAGSKKGIKRARIPEKIGLRNFSPLPPLMDPSPFQTRTSLTT